MVILQTSGAFANIVMGMIDFNQVSFKGGLSAMFDLMRKDVDSYPLLVNGRVRENVIEAINAPVRDEQIPVGTLQNITAVGSVEDVSNRERAGPAPPG